MSAGAFRAALNPAPGKQWGLPDPIFSFAYQIVR